MWFLIWARQNARFTIIISVWFDMCFALCQCFKCMPHRYTVGALSEIRLHLARVPWRSVDFLFFYVVFDVFLYIFIDFAGLEGLVIYWAVLLTGFWLYPLLLVSLAIAALQSAVRARCKFNEDFAGPLTELSSYRALSMIKRLFYSRVFNAWRACPGISAPISPYSKAFSMEKNGN